MTGLSTPTQRKGFASRSSAFTVSAGILLSRLLGLVRDRVFAHYLRQLNCCRCVPRRIPHSQLSADPFWRGCALRVIHPRVCPPAGGRAARGSLAAGRSDLRHPPSHRVTGHIGRRLRCPLADRRDCARLQGRDAPPRHPTGANPVSRSRAAGDVGMVPGDPEQSP